mgnify:CR=1 FL=1
MGYRSTMVLGVPKEKQKDLLKLDLGNSADKFADIFEQEKYDTIDEGIVIYRGEYLKWYDEFKDRSLQMKTKDYVISKLRDLRDETPCLENSQTNCGCEKFDEIIDIIEKNL